MNPADLKLQIIGMIRTNGCPYLFHDGQMYAVFSSRLQRIKVFPEIVAK